jgi:serine/threonine protein kinase
MSTTKTVKDSRSYLSLLQKSGLLTDDQLAAARQLAEAGSDPKTFARQLVKRQLLTSWQATQLLGGYHELMLGKYKLCRQLGRSGIGRVYLAEHTQMVRQVAIKTLSRRHTSQPKVVAKFLADARAAAKLDHRNIVHVYDVDSADDRFFLVMEYVEGRDLQRAVEEDGPLSPEKTALTMRQAARGLAHAHSRELLHGDLNPADLIADDQGVVKILALGLGRLSGANREASDLNGHPEAYHAPEERAGKIAMNVAGDVFALGAVMYYLLVGKPPTTEHGARDLLRQRRDLPQDLARICARMMASDPAKRYAALTDVEEALEQWINENVSDERLDEPESERESGPGELPDSFDWSPDTPETVAAPVIVANAPRSRSTSPQPGPIQENSPSPATGRKKSKTAQDPKAGKAKLPRAKAAKARENPPGGAPIDDEGPTATPPKKKPATRPAVPLGLVVGGGAGVVAVVALICVLLFLLMGNRGGSPVASNDQADQAAATDHLESDPSAKDNLESDGPDPLESDPPDPLESPAQPDEAPSAGQSSLGQPGSIPPTTDGPATTEGSETPGSKTTAPDGAGPTAGTPPQPEVPGPAGEAGKPGDTPAEPKPPAADPDPNSEPTPPPAAPPADPKPPAPKPVPPKPQPPVKPFAGFGKVVSLPEIGKSEPAAPFVLGPVQVPEKLICFVKLRGGTNACKGTPEFVLRNAKSGTDERGWEFFLTGSKGDGEFKVADMMLQDGKLQFQWTAEAASDSNAEYLRNCALSMNVGPEVHEVALRAPVTIEPLVINLDKVADVYRIDIDTLPDPTAVRLQLVKVEGEAPPSTLEPDAPVLALKGEQRIKFGQQAEEQVLELDLDVNTKRDIQVTVTPYFRWPLDEKPGKLTKATASKAERFALLARQQLIAELTRMREIEKTLAANEKPIAAQQISLKEQQLMKVEGGVQAVERLKGLYQTINEKAQLHFRVFYDADGIQVDLAVVAAAAAPAP